MIRIGPAGIPLSAKNRTTIDGVKCVAELGLQAMEIEFVRGVNMSNEAAREVGKIAKLLNIELSIHAPYYINLNSNDKVKVASSIKRIKDSLERGAAMGATIVVIHAGYYGGMNSEETTNKIIECLEKIPRFDGIKIGLETTGKVRQWGSIDEILEVCKKMKGCAPVIDFAHIYARQGGRIDFGSVLDRFKGFKHLHCHFSAINWSPAGEGMGNERNHLPIKEWAPDFRLLAKELVKRKLDITIINESPLLENDALLMKEIIERQGYKWSDK